MTIILDNDRLGAQLRQLRMKKKISQKALAAACGVTVYRIRMLEAGRLRALEDSLLADICRVLEIDSHTVLDI